MGREAIADALQPVTPPALDFQLTPLAPPETVTE
jgi:hypothetical protein